MRTILLTTFATATLCVSPAMARDPAPSNQSDKPVNQRDISAGDVAATPLSDLNVRKTEMPPVLFAALEQGYSLRGLASCQQLSAAIIELNTALGDDIDMPQSGEQRMSAGRVAQSVIGSFIPFRGVIREVSGANNRDRDMQSAVLAAVARRSFLKGTGQARGCRYPARSATLAAFNQRMNQQNAEAAKRGDGRGKDSK